MPYRFCFCHVKIITERPRFYKGFEGIWSRCIKCRGWIEIKTTMT